MDLLSYDYDHRLLVSDGNHDNIRQGSTRKMTSASAARIRKLLVGGLSILGAVVFVAFVSSPTSMGIVGIGSSGRSSNKFVRYQQQPGTVTIFCNYNPDDPVARKQLRDLRLQVKQQQQQQHGGKRSSNRHLQRQQQQQQQRSSSSSSSRGFSSSSKMMKLSLVVMSLNEQRDFLLDLLEEESLLLAHRRRRRRRRRSGNHHENNNDHDNSSSYYCGGEKAVQRFDEFVRMDLPHFATELWKYCALVTSAAAGDNPAAYIDLGNPMLVRIHDLLGGKTQSSSSTSSSNSNNNIAVLGDSYMPRTVHGSFLYLQSKDRFRVAKSMLELLVETPADFLLKDENRVLIPRALYGVIASTAGVRDLSTLVGGDLTEQSKHRSNGNHSPWKILEEVCAMESLTRNNAMEDDSIAVATAKTTTAVASWTEDNSYRLHHHCPETSSFCCSVYDKELHHVVQAIRHPISPLAERVHDSNSVAAVIQQQQHQLQLQLLNSNSSGMRHQINELPYTSTVSVIKVHHQSPPKPTTGGGLFDELLRNNCLPSEECNDCLSESGCDECGEVCSCYCRTLCQFESSPTLVTKKLVVTPPYYGRDSTRLIPTVIHQLTPHDLTGDDAGRYYPDASRAAQSYRMSGWEYRFYTDSDIRKFLASHFPVEVVQAYDDMIPRDVKLDLFRYAVLLIHGGVFADIDTLLECSLDSAIDPDVGFMVPIDDKTEGCLWPGFIASTPGHPFVAKALENVVNQVRNRYTLVDIDYTLCPNPEVGLSDTRQSKLFAYSSCLLAKSVNSVLNKPLYTPFEPGDVHIIQKEKTATKAAKTLSSSPPPKLPGRVVILNGDRSDMGGHRFTLTNKNLIVAQAHLDVLEDLLDEYDNSENNENDKRHEDTDGPYQFDSLYVDNERANEDIRINVDIPW